MRHPNNSPQLSPSPASNSVGNRVSVELSPYSPQKGLPGRLWGELLQEALIEWAERPET
jgi:hypothetical protein